MSPEQPQWSSADELLYAVWDNVWQWLCGRSPCFLALFQLWHVYELCFLRFVICVTLDALNGDQESDGHNR